MLKRFLLLAVLSALFAIAAACGGGETIEIGAQTYTETKIMAYINQALIEDRTDYSVNVTPDIAASPPVIDALSTGELDIGLLYTGEIFNNHFPGVEDTHDPEEVLRQAQEGFNEHYDFNWFDPLGWENTYAMTVRKDVAEELGLEKISDLKDVAENMRLGVDTTWLEREIDGYPAFIEHYGFSFGEEYSMDINLVYEAVANEEVDIVLAYSTDPRILEFDLQMLEDDQQFFPPYDACIVARNETLEQYPELEDILTLLTGEIDEETITRLNYEVDIEQRNPQDVAREFLQEKGLLE